MLSDTYCYRLGDVCSTGCSECQIAGRVSRRPTSLSYTVRLISSFNRKERLNELDGAFGGAHHGDVVA